MTGYDYISAITGCTTDVRGRFAVRGPAFELLADGSVATGGPGKAPGPLDLLVSALVVNLLNVLRADGDPDADNPGARARAGPGTHDAARPSGTALRGPQPSPRWPASRPYPQNHRDSTVTKTATRTRRDQPTAAGNRGDRGN
jgi:hypothetical protein